MYIYLCIYMYIYINVYMLLGFGVYEGMFECEVVKS